MFCQKLAFWQQGFISTYTCAISVGLLATLKIVCYKPTQDLPQGLTLLSDPAPRERGLQQRGDCRGRKIAVENGVATGERTAAREGDSAG